MSQDRICKYAAYYLSEFFDVMHEALTLCMKEEKFFREQRKEFDETPGRFIESILDDVERLSSERGQVAVWVAYALYEMVA